MARSFLLLVFLATSISPALAHWNYNRLIVNGEVIGEAYQYVRRTNNSNSPLTNVNSTTMRCNSGGDSGASTQTYTVTAGDELGFTINDTFGHPGPQQVYISKAPGAASEYDGSGGWARIHSVTTKPNFSSADQGWIYATRKAHSFLFTLPAETPPGEYLVRAEGLALHAAHKFSEAQFYVGCAQVKVVGNGTQTPGPLIKFPGGYTGYEPGIFIPVFWSSLTNYTAAGPALWPQGTVEQHVMKTLPGNPALDGD